MEWQWETKTRGASQNSSSDRVRKTDTEFKSPESDRKVHGVLVIMQGIPGIGKSTQTRTLVDELTKRGISSVGLEQDPFYAKFGRLKSGKMCLQEFKNYVYGGKHKVVFLLRNNALYSQFQLYADHAIQNDWAYMLLLPKSLTLLHHY
eukprot:TRINITY_DN12743_c0_g1_i1.p1 TRINITY_DN12743_c0_g1~~TRINITY_DN12743_c0_g1_i1.p1  ORF type:complete len:148 (+),score=12.03 TRINITY_DN12743_c0_g1_i1:396-839(+)